MKADRRPDWRAELDDRLGDRLALVDQHRFVAADQARGLRFAGSWISATMWSRRSRVPPAFGQGEDDLITWASGSSSSSGERTMIERAFSG